MRSLFIFHILVVYVFVQFCWWTYLMVELNLEVHSLKTELLRSTKIDENQFLLKQTELDEHLFKRKLMVVGEGSVFLALLAAGIFITRKSFLNEMMLARQQKNFLLSVSHELKSPIASVKLYLQTLQKRELDREKQQQIYVNAISETERLVGLIDKLLLATRIDNRSFPIHKENTDMAVFIRDTLNKAPQFQQGGNNVKVELEEGIMADIDINIFASVILNLIENAIKYSPHGSPIYLRLFKRNGKTILTVSDEGYGIKNIEKQKIFEKFYRIGNEETRKSKGTGLGLFIVKYIVEQHHGNIIVKDNAPQGTIFEIEL